MGPLVHMRLASWRRSGVIAGVCAVALLMPSLCRAADPVEDLRQALKDPRPTTVDLKLTRERDIKIQAAIADLEKLKTISHRRRAYFLTEWSQYQELRDLEHEAIRKKMAGHRMSIG